MRQNTNLCIREDNAAHQVVLQIPLNRQSKRFLDQTAPRFEG